ncbi:MAG: hypothetical protein NVSMB6_05430 [Burkholderiaceae bacterium]
MLVLGSACIFQTGEAAAQGATSTAVSSPTGNPYKPCMDGSSSEDRTTCMKEAGAAKEAAKRGQLTSNDGSFERNAMQRCDVLPAADQEACRLRVSGVGSTSGSVAAGGVVREVVTQTPVAGGATPLAPAAPGRGSDVK